MLACLPILLYLDYTNAQIKRSLFMVVMGLQGKWVKQERKIRHNVKDLQTSGAFFFFSNSTFIHQFSFFITSKCLYLFFSFLFLFTYLFSLFFQLPILFFFKSYHMYLSMYTPLHLFLCNLPKNHSQ